MAPTLRHLPKLRLRSDLRARLHWELHELGCRVFGGIAPKLYRWEWLRYLPQWPFKPPPPPTWPDYVRTTPKQLKTTPIWRDEDLADRAAKENPLYGFFVLHPEGARLNPRFGWAWQIPSVPSRLRTRFLQQRVSAPEAQPTVAPPDTAAEMLSEEIRREGKRLGLSAIGFAPFDPRYRFIGGTGLAHLSGPALSALSEGSVIVCLLEQDWKLTQTIPSGKCERGVMRTYAQLAERTGNLTEFLHARGIRAELHTLAGPLVSIHYAVQAGLGQLGLNGQLLTPNAGSRCRITVITTNAKLVHGGPVDYGIHSICDECQLCVRRCPPGAIPKNRAYHRGVKKAKIKVDRCLPVVAQAHGCAICMKVCPIQRYGLESVADHYLETGEILGKGSDELEGYTWLDGRHYGPGEKPRITREFMTPLGLRFDPNRTSPPGAEKPDQRKSEELAEA